MPRGNAIAFFVRCFSYTSSGGVSVTTRQFYKLSFIPKLIKKTFVKSKVSLKNNHAVIKNYGCFLTTHIKAWTSYFIFSYNMLSLQKASLQNSGAFLLLLP